MSEDTRKEKAVVETTEEVSEQEAQDIVGGGKNFSIYAFNPQPEPPRPPWKVFRPRGR